MVLCQVDGVCLYRGHTAALGFLLVLQLEVAPGRLGGGQDSNRGLSRVISVIGIRFIHYTIVTLMLCNL